MILPKKYNENEKSYGPDISGIGENWKVISFSLNEDGESYSVEAEWCGPCPFEISQLQGKLQLEKMGLYATVEAIVNEAGPPTKIYWETASTWRRTNPILLDLAKKIGMSENALDHFFINAAKIR